jgi:uncharacterized membrane protein YsdA (DUF1294 family)
MIAPTVPIVYAAVSIITFAVYGLDKAAAVRGWSRVPERLLHLLGLLGGWPGGFAAQRVFRHKCCKFSFQVFFWTVAATNIIFLLLLRGRIG